MENYNKLVRDKIPEILDEKGVVYEKKTASPEEYRTELIKKLYEEIKEFLEAGDVEELADIIEVIKALEQLPEYSQVETVRLSKREQKGAFEKRFILKGEKD